MDYIDKLNPEEQKFMNDFMAEYNNAEVGSQSEAEQNRFHRTAEEVKDCTDRNNARNRDMYGKAKAEKMIAKLNYDALIENIEENKDYGGLNPTEDMMIDLLDASNDSED